MPKYSNHISFASSPSSNRACGFPAHGYTKISELIDEKDGPHIVPMFQVIFSPEQFSDLVHNENIKAAKKIIIEKIMMQILKISGEICEGKSEKVGFWPPLKTGNLAEPINKPNLKIYLAHIYRSAATKKQGSKLR